MAIEKDRLVFRAIRIDLCREELMLTLYIFTIGSEDGVLSEDRDRHRFTPD
jgi:hypothetical protein